MAENHEFIKEVSGGVIAGAVNHYLSYGSDINSETIKYSVMFGSVVGAGFLASSMLAPSLAAQQSSNTHWMSAKTLEHRVIEVGLGTGAVVLANKYLFMTTPQSMMRTAGMVLLADFAGEYVADYMTSQPLSYFA